MFQSSEKNFFPLSVHCMLYSWVLFFVSCIFLTGCTTVKKVKHLPQLLTLKHYSEAQEAIAGNVEEQNRLFDELRDQVESGEFVCQSSREVEQLFGAPVYKREVMYQGRKMKQWLYRHAKDYGGDKVYLYFDDEERPGGVEYVKVGE